MYDSSTTYGPLTKLLHWSSAALTLGLFGLGLWMVELDYYHTWYHTGPSIHISLGLLLFALTLVRLLWRFFNPQVAALNSHPGWATKAAAVVKKLLYGLLLIILTSGYFITTAEGQPARLFELLSVPSLAQLDGSQVDWLGIVHLWGAWALILLVASHAGAALFHHLVHKDVTLRRMLPFSKLSSNHSHSTNRKG